MGRTRGAVGSDQDGAGVAQVGPQRLPDAPAQLGGCRLQGTALSRIEGTPPGQDRVVDCSSLSQGDEGNRTVAAQDER